MSLIESAACDRHSSVPTPNHPRYAQNVPHAINRPIRFPGMWSGQSPSNASRKGYRSAGMPLPSSTTGRSFPKRHSVFWGEIARRGEVRERLASIGMTLAGQEGFEPPTLGFGVRCSTNSSYWPASWLESARCAPGVSMRAFPFSPDGGGCQSKSRPLGVTAAEGRWQRGMPKKVLWMALTPRSSSFLRTRK